MMSKLAILVFTFSIIAQSLSFFTYSDCDVECQSKESCVISEQTKRYFACHCLQSEIACEMLATPRVVCLRPRREPIGGDDIWSDYEQRNSTTTEAPPVPRPTNKPTPGHTSKIALISIMAAILTVMVSATAFIALWQRWRRREYTRIQPSATDSPYQSTVEEIE